MQLPIWLDRKDKREIVCTLETDGTVTFAPDLTEAELKETIKLLLHELEQAIRLVVQLEEKWKHNL